MAIGSQHTAAAHDDSRLYINPLSTLMLAGVGIPSHLHHARICVVPALWETKQWGISSLRRAPRPDGLAQAFVSGGICVGQKTDSIGLGDNIYTDGLPEQLQRRRSGLGRDPVSPTVRDPSAMAS